MITCPNCGKENQDHYKFCLGCGSKLPQVGAAPQPAAPPQAAPTPPRPAAPPPPPPPRATGSTGAPANRIAAGGAATGPIGAPRQPAPLGAPPGAAPAPPPMDAMPPGPPLPPGPQPFGSQPTGAAPPQPSGPTAAQRMQPTAPQPIAPQTNGPMPQPIGSQPTAPLASPAPMPGMMGPPGPQPPAPGLPMQFAGAGSGGTLGGGPNSAPPSAAQAPGVCGSCAFQSPPGFAFCGRCGTPLAVPAAAAPENVGSAQTIFVGNSRDAATPEPQPMQPQPPQPMPPQPMPPQPMPPQPMAPQAMPPEPMAPQPDGQAAAPHLGVAAPVVGSSGTAPGSQSPPVPPIAPGVPVRLVMLGPDGQPIGERVLAGGEAIDVGRDAGPPWDDDAYLDPKHATMRAAEAGVMIEDHHSLNGVFVKLTGRTELRNGDQFRVGQELLSYEELPEPTPTDDGTERMGSPNPGYWGRVSVLVDPAMASSAFAMAGEGLGIGREVGEITFPTDGYVSGRHCRIVGDDSGIFLEDLGSSNGTYMRVRTGQVLPFGSLVLIGQKLFQLERA